MGSLAEQFLQDLGSSEESGDEAGPADQESMAVEAFMAEAAASQGSGFGERQRMLERANALLAGVRARQETLYGKIHRCYNPIFPELEELVPDPEQYWRVVAIMWKQRDPVKAQLEDAVPAATALVIRMTFANTSGSGLEPRSAEEEAQMDSLCEDLEREEAAKKQLLETMQEMTPTLAPNLCALVGMQVTAQLLALTGGLEELANVPGCNIQSIGTAASSSSGPKRVESVAAAHRGALFGARLLQDVPPGLQSKIVRKLANKVALAARIDAHRPQGAFDCSAGEEMRVEIENKVKKLLEPAPQKRETPLPAPLEKPKKRRGGKRFRKMKEKYQTTELAKMKNRVAFGQAETVDYGDEEGFGMLKQEGTGMGRIRPKDTQKLGQRAAKRFKPEAVHGTASVIAFTPVQGIDLPAPNSNETQKHA